MPSGPSTRRPFASSASRARGGDFPGMLTGEEIPIVRTRVHWILALLILLSMCAPFSCSQTTTTTSTGGPSGNPTGSAQCPLVNGCVDGDASTCFSLFTQCVGGSCCRPNFGCWECNCDEQCPLDRPFCTEGLCGE